MRPSKEDSKSGRKFPPTQAENFGTLLRRGSGRPEKAAPPLPPSVTKSFSVGTGLRLPDPPGVSKSNASVQLEHIDERRDHFPQEPLPPKSYPHHSSPSRQHLQALAALRFQQQQLFQQQQIFHQQLLQQSRHQSFAGGMPVEPLLPPRAKRADSNTQTARRTSITRSGSVTDQRKFVSPFPPPDFVRDFANSSKSPQKQALHNLLSIPSSHYSSLSAANVLSKSDAKNPELPIPPDIQLETTPFQVPSSSTCSEEDVAIPQCSKPATTDAVGSSKSSSGDTSNSSTDSVIFRPSSCDDSDANDGQPDHITSLRNKKNMNKNDSQKPSLDQKMPSAGQSNISMEKILNDSKILKPLQPISTSMPYAFLRSLSTLSQGKSQGSSDPSERPLSSPSHRSTQSDSFHRTNHHNITPSFGKLYSPVVLSTTTASAIPYTIDDHLKKFPKQHVAPSGNGNSGYLSDGEILKSGASQDIGSGYLSEGGATLYVRRIQQRFREGLLAVQESLERNQSKAEDTSLEDVSSISSSDISNAVNDISTDDNITFSSLSACSSNKDSKSVKKTKDSNNEQSHHHHYHYQKQEQSGMQNPSPSFYQGAASFNSLPSYYRADNWLQHFNNQGQMVYSTPLHGLERTDQMSSLSGKVGVAVGGDGKTRELLPSAGIYIKKGGQACIVPADTRSRSHAKVQTFPHHVSGGMAVAIDAPLEEELLRDGNVDDVVRSLPNSGSVVNFSHRGAGATRSASFNKDTIRRYFYPIRDLPSTASNKAPSLLRQGLLGGPKKQQQREGHVALDRSQSCREQKDQDVEVTNERPLSEGTYNSDGGAKARQGSMPDSESFENFSTFPFFTSSSIPRNWTIGGYGSSHFAGYVGLYDGQPLYQQLPYHLSSFNEFSPGNNLGRAESNLMSSATGGKGSSLSLLSSSSSVYSSAEDKQVQEIRKLKRELEAAQDKVNTLSTQLNTNAHVVAAFEQSLSSMTQRLQHLTSSSQQKDSDLNNLRLTIEMLKQQQQLNKLNEPLPTSNQSADNQPAWMTSTTSVSSLSSFNTGQSNDAKSKHKKKNWLRASFGKAFSRRKNLQQQQQQASSSDVEVGSSKDQLLISSMSTPTSPTKLNDNQNNMTQSDCSGDVVVHLRQQLHEKDLRLTDVQLEALSSAHQLEQLYDVINRMKNEMASLRADNERLHRVIHQGGIELVRLESPSPAPTIVRSDTVQFAPVDTSRQDERKVKVYVQSGDSMNEGLVRKIAVGVVLINNSTTWDVLDSAVKKGFKEHLQRIQPNCGLGLSSDSISFYQVGSVVRSKASKPDLVPLSCLVDGNSSISILLKGAREKCVDSLSFETLIPKSIVQRYVSLMLEHRRIILSGSSGTGKTFLAQKLAQHVVLGTSSSDFDPTSLIATFNVDRKTSKEVHQYLSNVAEQCQVETTDLPSIIILDNLHHVGSLADVFAGFFGVKMHQRCPFLIGTMNQAVNLATANLQLHHNFKWILCVNHLEPVKGFLGRFLRRKLIEQEVENFGGTKNPELEKVVNWLPTIWQHINKFLETNISSDITLGPRLFLSCPMDLNESQAWFTDLWNFSIMPYLLEAAQSCENKGEWMDPSNYVLATYPWNKMVRPSLLQLVSDDPSLEQASSSSSSSLWKEDKISASSSATVLHRKDNDS